MIHAIFEAQMTVKTVDETVLKIEHRTPEEKKYAYTYLLKDMLFPFPDLSPEKRRGNLSAALTKNIFGRISSREQFAC